jgi:glycosyltransferase involved in cell wall biosynthesis
MTAAPRSDRPAVSVVVVAHDMARELPRTLRSLAPDHQQGIDPGAYEVIVVDNGSPEPLDEALITESAPGARTARLDPAPPSPARAANLGLEMARGDLIGLIIDGARLASPGLLSRALLAQRLAARPVIASLSWHLGPGTHMEAGARGYDQTTEDALLADVGWEDDGYRLFAVSSLAGASRRGWFGPLGESNALFLPRALWHELDGLDERFALPGGGLVNHDTFRRACALDGVELIVLLGEGTFHQLHGGAATSGRLTRDEMFADYLALRGEEYRPPTNEPLYLGSIPPSALEHLQRSVEWALRARS